MDRTDLIDAIAKETGIRHLTVSCALQPCYEDRAARVVGMSGVRQIQAVAKRIQEAEKEEAAR